MQTMFHVKHTFTIFVGIALFIYIVNHILLVKVNGGKNLFLYTISKWDGHSFIRFLFPETCLYLIIFGIDAVGLFIHEFRRSMTYFLLLFLSLLAYKYITCVSTYR